MPNALLPSRPKGFSLIELLVVLGLIALISTWAYPAYQRHVQRGQVAQARTALLEQLLQQEQHLQGQGHYLYFELGMAPAPLRQRPSDTSPYTLGARPCSEDNTCVQAYATAPQLPTLTATNHGDLGCLPQEHPLCH